MKYISFLLMMLTAFGMSAQNNITAGAGENNGEDNDILYYYILGLGGDNNPSQSNRFLTNEEGSENPAPYVFPKIHVKNKSTFQIVDSTDKVMYGGAPKIKESEGVIKSTLNFDGDPVTVDIPTGYYNVYFTPQGDTATVEFIYCTNQSDPDYCMYVLTGFGEDIRFDRRLATVTRNDDGISEMNDQTFIYVIDNVHLAHCSNGFLINAVDDEIFSYGRNDLLFPYQGGTISDKSPSLGVGINGIPIDWIMSEGDYTVTFYVAGSEGRITFEPAGSDGNNSEIESIVNDTESKTVYYNLAGRPIIKPGKGFYIKKTSSGFTKIMK